MARKINPLDNPKDRKLMEQLYLKHARLILALASKYVDDPEDRKDVMQSVAENLVKRLTTIKGLSDKAMAAYIAYAVRNAAINYYKAEERKKMRFVSLDDEEVLRQVDREFQDIRNLERVGYEADYIITHCAPTSVQQKLNPDFSPDPLTNFLEEVKGKTDYRYWLFGHYHDNKAVDKTHILLWEQMVQII